MLAPAATCSMRKRTKSSFNRFDTGQRVERDLQDPAQTSKRLRIRKLRQTAAAAAAAAATPPDESGTGSSIVRVIAREPAQHDRGSSSASSRSAAEGLATFIGPTVTSLGRGGETPFTIALEAHLPPPSRVASLRKVSYRPDFRNREELKPLVLEAATTHIWIPGRPLSHLLASYRRAAALLPP